MKIFITGATGYFGNKLALEAARKGWLVHALVRDPYSNNIPSHPGIILFKGDITDKLSVEKAMYGCEQVIHSAAFTKETANADLEFQKINVEGTKNVLETALRFNISRLVFTSSCSVFGPSGDRPISEADENTVAPTTGYALSKYKAEKLVMEYCNKGLRSVIVSPSRIYGPGNLPSGNPVTNLIMGIVKRRITFSPSDPKITGNYIFIDDVVKGHFLALEKGLPGEKYILSGENISFENFFYTIRKLTGKRILVIPVSKSLLKTSAWIYNAACRLSGSEKRLLPELIDRVWQNRAFSCEKAISQLGYTVTPFIEGLRFTIDFFNRQNNKKSKDRHRYSMS